ncbi:ABC transporter ATP-binding protein [Aquirhabdus parva]|nr:ATP-binding cassette domain-containing protein [Aquirhabdus parva]
MNSSVSKNFVESDRQIAADISRISSKKTALEIRGVQKRFKDFVALQHIDLHLYEGELLCFLGPSGCGKTTLLRLVAGLDEVDEGQIIKNGQDISRLKTEKRRCGIVFQNYALFPNLSISDNIAYGLQGKKWTKPLRQERVSELLSLIGLQGSELKYPLQLSGGQQQRVALARAIAPEPDILLLDEPLSALDARVRLHLRQEIRALQKRLNMPTILVTHDQEEALTLADRIVVMNHGVIEQVDTPEVIYNKPASQFVATFVGQMNLLPAKIQAEDWLYVADKVDVRLKLKHQFIPNTGVLVGFRPESARIVSDDSLVTQGIRLSTYLIAREFLGAKTRLHLSLDPSHAAITDLAERTIQIDVDHAATDFLSIDSQVIIDIDEKQLHVFDQDGRAIC